MQRFSIKVLISSVFSQFTSLLQEFLEQGNSPQVLVLGGNRFFPFFKSHTNFLWADGERIEARVVRQSRTQFIIIKQFLSYHKQFLSYHKQSLSLTIFFLEGQVQQEIKATSDA